MLQFPVTAAYSTCQTKPILIAFQTQPSRRQLGKTLAQSRCLACAGILYSRSDFEHPSQSSDWTPVRPLRFSANVKSLRARLLRFCQTAHRSHQCIVSMYIENIPSLCIAFVSLPSMYRIHVHQKCIVSLYCICIALIDVSYPCTSKMYCIFVLHLYRSHRCAADHCQLYRQFCDW